MAADTTLILVQKAKEGDASAKKDLMVRFYQDWIENFHGALGKTLRKLYDTTDLVQSAIADALKHLPTLRNEGVFYVWVTSIIRHKMMARKRRLKRERPLEGMEEAAFEKVISPSNSGQRRLDDDEMYLQTLDAILGLFPEHPEEMTAVALKLLDGRTVGFITEFLNISERSAFRRLQDGVALLKAKVET